MRRRLGPELLLAAAKQLLHPRLPRGVRSNLAAGSGKVARRLHMLGRSGARSRLQNVQRRRLLVNLGSQRVYPRLSVAQGFLL